jgi:hypothetical protein
MAGSSFGKTGAGALSSGKIGPLPLPGGDPAKVSASPRPLMPVGAPATPYRMGKAVRPNRRLGARKAYRMAFTPPQKLTAFKTP